MNTFDTRLDLCGQGFEHGSRGIHLYPATAVAADWSSRREPRWRAVTAWRSISRARNRMNITNVKLTAMQFHAWHVGQNVLFTPISNTLVERY